MFEIEQADFRVPVKSWIPPEEIEGGALEQIVNAAKHPDVGAHIAIMPDVHVGFGVTIGSVFPTLNNVAPNAVGVDIGCGMCAIDSGVAFDPERMDRAFWRQWAGQVRRDVPSGFNVHRNRQQLGPLERPLHATPLQPLLREKAALQLGTLGGGNHFLEAQVADDFRIWLMVHSGSRHTGLRIANHYNGLAKDITGTMGRATTDDLPVLPIDDRIGHEYLEDAAWATDFALESRRIMLDRMLSALQMQVPDASNRAGMINIHHNFARIETHDGQEVVVHRKGATSAQEGEIGIIPGSMGAPSYIVRGKGNPESLASCSHGAGRLMGRNTARKTISEREFVASLEGTFSKPSMSYVDEAPGAYKDIETVIARQLDLVDIVHKLTPIMTIKGDSKARDD